MSELDWLIIGGGPHGVHLAARLVGQARVDAARVAILDPGPRLLDRWHAFTTATGMSHLRSPGVHHLDLEPFSLTRFAGDRRTRPLGLVRGPHDRPSLDLFNRHCAHVIARFGLADLHHRGEAERVQPVRGGVRVTTVGGAQLDSRRVVLAIGAGGQPEWPTWAPRDEPRVQHIFGTRPPTGLESADVGRAVVVGGGISAAQVALRLVDQGRPVDWVTRHPLRVHQFDSDPGWLGPKLMPLFQRERCRDRRRRLIQEARYRGSVPPDVRQSLRAAVASGCLEVHEDVVSDLHADRVHVRLHLASSRVLEGSRVYLATGFVARRPGGPMIDRLVEELALKCAACGYPVVDRALRWHRRIHVSGPLAELELGPVARNIAGARRAGDRLVEALAKLRQRPGSRRRSPRAATPTNALGQASPPATTGAVELDPRPSASS